MIDDYFKAKRMADRSIRRAVLEGRYPYLSDLDSKPGMSDTLSCIDLGIKEIPIQQIRGTKTKGRQGVFGRGKQAGFRFEISRCDYHTGYSPPRRAGSKDPGRKSYL